MKNIMQLKSDLRDLQKRLLLLSALNYLLEHGGKEFFDLIIKTKEEARRAQWEQRMNNIAGSEQVFELPASLDHNWEKGEPSLLEHVPNEDEDIYKKVHRRELSLIMLPFVERLPPKQRRVILENFGMKGGDPKNMSEIARENGVTIEAIRKLKNKALNQLRSYLMWYHPDIATLLEAENEH